MSDLLPLFPLPNVVLFPNVFLPLHIFEPRYREMVGDALAGDRMIGMVLLKPGWESDYEGRPPVYPIGCSGVITHAERLQDGRFNIVLRRVARRAARDEADDGARSADARRGALNSCWLSAVSSRDRLDDFLPVKSAVLDEDRRRVLAAQGAACDEQSRNVGLEGVGIVRRHAAAVERYAGRGQQVPVGGIPGEQKHGIGRQFLETGGATQDHRSRPG